MLIGLITQSYSKLLLMLYKKEFLHIFSICWYTPAEHPPPKLAEANKIVANDESIKRSSKPADQIKQR